MSGVAERLKHDAVVIGVGISLDDTLVVDELARGCAADKSGSVKVGDTIIAVNGNKSLTAALAKELVLGQQGTYATISFKRTEGNDVRTFKVQLMRGSADYIYLVECLRGLEQQVASLQVRLVPSVCPAALCASFAMTHCARFFHCCIRSQAENSELRKCCAFIDDNKTTESESDKVDDVKHNHRDEISGLLVRIQELERLKQEETANSRAALRIAKEENGWLQKEIERMRAEPAMNAKDLHAKKQELEQVRVKYEALKQDFTELQVQNAALRQQTDQVRNVDAELHEDKELPIEMNDANAPGMRQTCEEPRFGKQAAAKNVPTRTNQRSSPLAPLVGDAMFVSSNQVTEKGVVFVQQVDPKTKCASSCPASVAVSSQELRRKLLDFFGQVCPEKVKNVDGIIKSFEANGATADELRDLNAELFERYGRDLRTVSYIGSQAHGNGSRKHKQPDTRALRRQPFAGVAPSDFTGMAPGFYPAEVFDEIDPSSYVFPDASRLGIPAVARGSVAALEGQMQGVAAYLQPKPIGFARPHHHQPPHQPETERREQIIMHPLQSASAKMTVGDVDRGRLPA